MKSMYLTPNLYNKLYSHMTYDNVLAIRVSLETGMRIDDVLSLKRCNLIGRKICYTAEKTGKADKKPISQGLLYMLYKNLDTDRLDEYIFKHRLNPKKHRTRQAVWKNLKKACGEVGLDRNVTPHSARKSYAVELFHDKGLKITQKELQHDNPGTTMLYAFSDLLCNDEEKKKSNNIDLEYLSEIISERVVEKLIEKIPNLTKLLKN